jgi:hypothetical protein
MTESKRIIPDARHEHTDIGEKFIWGAAASMGALLALCALIAFRLYPHLPLNGMLQGPLPLYPEPRLQSSPPTDMARFHAQELQKLNGSGWIDQAHGVMHIPIAQAMREVAAQGIAGWPAAPATAGGK